jgi:hypothetical protein
VILQVVRLLGRALEWPWVWLGLTVLASGAILIEWWSDERSRSRPDERDEDGEGVTDVR